LESDNNHECDLEQLSKYYTVDEFNVCVRNIELVDAFLCVHVNCNRILPKFDEFVSLFNQLSLKPACIAVTETWLKPEQAATLLMDQYTFHSVERTHKSGGGVGVFVHNRFVSVICVCDIHKFTTFEHLTVKLFHMSTCVAVVSTIYRPPDRSVNTLNQFSTDLCIYITFLQNLCDNPNISLFVCGDFNINLLEIDCNTHVMDFVDLIYSFSLFPSILRPTRIATSSATLIDNIFINSTANLFSGQLLLNLSDHLPIFSLVSTASRNTSTKHFAANIKTRNIVDYNKLIADLASYSWDFITDLSSVDDDYDSFIRHIRSSVIKYSSSILVVNKARSNVPWITSGLLQSINNKHKLYKKTIY
jgi:hypothetical protein